ncbi:MAG: MBL fold metallo-hydrolase [Patescibacteria group bacterium]
MFTKINKLVILICVGVALYYFYQQSLPGNLTGSFVAFLDVGQGDAIYIRTSNGSDVLIDGGPDRKILEQLPKVLAPQDNTIELMLLTHPDADHIDGLIEVVKRYSVKQIITTALPAEKSDYKELLNLIETKNIQHTVVQQGNKIVLGEQDDIDILYPEADTPLTTLSTNNTSLVAEYHYKNQTTEKTILLVGDAETPVEDELLKQNLLHDVDILKVGHHGSKTSSSEAFLQKITPELCIIEVGKDNSYGHPHAEVVHRLQQYCEIKRTDDWGNIVINN